jgi:VanZ family protein
MKFLKITVICTALVIAYYSLKLPDGQDLPTNDKVGHCLAYLVLSLQLFLLSSSRNGRINLALVALGYGLLMEILQGFVPNRDPSFYDILANSTGVLLGFIFYFTIGSSILKAMRYLKLSR